MYDIKGGRIMTEESKRKLAEELENTPIANTIVHETPEHDGPYVKHIRLA